MKTQIVYVVISSDEDLFLEELWASLFSLRIYHPEATVKVLTDAPTAKRIYERPALNEMITEVVKVDVPEAYSPKERSRVIKTQVRNIITGDYLYIDADTVITHVLDEVDSINADVAAVPDSHLPFDQHPYAGHKKQHIKSIFGEDFSDSKYFYNGGVMLVRDTDVSHELYKRWYDNWLYSSFEKGDKDDQPALIKADYDMGNIIHYLPDKFNCQLAFTLRFLHEAYIVHFFHLKFLKDQSFSPFMCADVYKEIKEHHEITPHVEALIRNCKSSFSTTTMAVGKTQMYFLFSPTGQAFSIIRERNKTLTKVLDWISMKIIKYYRGKDKIKRKIKR